MSQEHGFEPTSWETLDRCTICQCEDLSPFETIHVDGMALDYAICRRCNTVFQSPRLTEEATQEYYASQYQTKLLGEGGTLEKDLRVQAGRARHIRSLLQPQLDSVRRMLDIGSAAGVLLRCIRAETGCEIVGVEPGEFYRKSTQAQGLQVYESIDALHDAQSSRFDLISMMHVLEHLRHPVSVLQDLRETLLSPSGYLILEVPNLYGHSSLELAHILGFNSSSLKTTLALAGYRVEWILSHGKPRSSILPLYLTLLARPAGDRENIPFAARPRQVQLLRKLGMARFDLFTDTLQRFAWKVLPARLQDDGWGELT